MVGIVCNEKGMVKLILFFVTCLFLSLSLARPIDPQTQQDLLLLESHSQQSWDEVKLAARKMMMQLHPDHIEKGLTPDEYKAEMKRRENAFDEVRQAMNRLSKVYKSGRLPLNQEGKSTAKPQVIDFSTFEFDWEYESRLIRAFFKPDQLPERQFNPRPQMTDLPSWIEQFERFAADQFSRPSQSGVETMVLFLKSLGMISNARRIWDMTATRTWRIEFLNEDASRRSQFVHALTGATPREILSGAGRFRRQAGGVAQLRLADQISELVGIGLRSGSEQTRSNIASAYGTVLAELAYSASAAIWIEDHPLSDTYQRETVYPLPKILNVDFGFSIVRPMIERAAKGLNAQQKLDLLLGLNFTFADKITRLADGSASSNYSDENRKFEESIREQMAGILFRKQKAELLQVLLVRAKEMVPIASQYKDTLAIFGDLVRVARSAKLDDTFVASIAPADLKILDPDRSKIRMHWCERLFMPQSR